jgi:hypothetical protein
MQVVTGKVLMCQFKYVPFDIDFVCSGQSGSLLGSSGWLVVDSVFLLRLPSCRNKQIGLCPLLASAPFWTRPETIFYCFVGPSISPASCYS